MTLWGAALRTAQRVCRALQSRAAPPRVAAGPPPPAPRERAALDWLLPDETEQRRHQLSEAQAPAAGLRDFILIEAASGPQIDELFDALRWGGQVLILGPNPGAVKACRQRFAGHPSWCCEQPDALPAPLTTGRGAPVHFSTIRKIRLERPGQLTARHSYEVSLVHRPNPGDPEPGRGSAGWAVEKRVPTHEETLARLTQTHAAIAPGQTQGVVRWLIQTAFPLMLTRETAFLGRLRQRMPSHLAGRTPELLDMQKDQRGLVSRIQMTWLRQGGETLSQLAFARQAAEMLDAAHREAGLMHMDVRLGNLVVTPRGVGLIDFGTSVMVGEDLAANRTVHKVIRRTLDASEITDNLRRHREKRLLGNPVFDALPHPPTPGFDLFALVTCMTRPHELEDFRGLVAFDPHGPDAIALSRLRRRVLAPPDGQAAPLTDLSQLAAALQALAGSSNAS